MRTTGIERGTLSAFEDFLSALVKGSPELVTLLKEDGILTVCQVVDNKDLVTLHKEYGILTVCQVVDNKDLVTLLKEYGILTVCQVVDNKEKKNSTLNIF